MKMKILTLALFGLAVFSTTTQASMMDRLIYNVAGQATNAAGARIGDEIYYGSSKGAKGKRSKRVKRKSKRRTKRAKRKHVRSVPVIPKMTDEKRIQKALTSLGFYKGKIDGEVNSYETRSAIKEMNIAYGISNNGSLAPQSKDTLIFLGTLFGFDRTLISSSTDNKTKGKKIQTSLKIHGFYHDKIDGAVGPGTRVCISNYKRDTTGSSSSSLDFEEEYALVSTAKEKNDKNIEDSIASLKVQNTMQTQPQYRNQTSLQQRPENGAPQQVNKTNYKNPQGQTPQVQQAQKVPPTAQLQQSIQQPAVQINK